MDQTKTPDFDGMVSCWAITTTEDHLEALEALLEKEEAKPWIEDTIDEGVHESVEKTIKAATGTAPSERASEMRNAIRTAIHEWRSQIESDCGTILVGYNSMHQVQFYWHRCRVLSKEHGERFIIDDEVEELVDELENKVRDAEQSKPHLLAAPEDVPLAEIE